MENEEKLEQQDNSGSTSTALTIDTESLKKESLDLINQIIAETDAAKTKDLTYLFNQNQNKKTIVRQNKLNDLQDMMVDQAINRFIKRPDEIDNTTLLQGLKTVQDMIERSQKQVSGVTEQPLIQINQQNNEINVGDNKQLNRESRDKISKLVSAIIGNTVRQPKIDEPEIIEVEETKNGN